MQVTSDFVRRNFDIFPAFLLFSFVASTLFWMPTIAGVSREVLAIAASPMLTTIGVFMAHRLNEKSRNPKLGIMQWGVYRHNKHSVRVFIEVGNAPGREVARDARATITIKKIKDRLEMPLETADLTKREELVLTDIPLVAYETVRVEGEPIPWMIPELPYRSKGVHDIELKHITNIGPGQRNRATILEATRLIDKLYYYLRVFSEYGAEIVKAQIDPPSAKYPLHHRLRCVLEPGIYRFYLQVSADKAYPITGVMEVDMVKDEIRFLKPRQEPISLSGLELEPTNKSQLVARLDPFN